MNEKARMIAKTGNRFSERIMRKDKTRPAQSRR